MGVPWRAIAGEGMLASSGVMKEETCEKVFRGGHRGGGGEMLPSSGTILGDLCNACRFVVELPREL